MNTLTARRLAFAVLAVLPALITAQPRITLVQSVPEETSLGLQETGRTKAVWLDMISTARKSIDIEQFYIANKDGEALSAIVDAIEKAAGRGVRVRVIAEKSFYAKYPATLDAWKRVPNLSVRILDFKSVTGSGVQHAKFFVTDGRCVFLGSQNFDWRSLSQIHETGVRIDNPHIAKALLSVFEMDWEYSASADAASARRAASVIGRSFPVRIQAGGGQSVSVTPVFSPGTFLPRGAQWDLPAIARMIDRARRNVSVQLLSYAVKDDTVLDAALRRAARRGVVVRLLVSNWSLGKSKIGALKDLRAGGGVEVRFSTIPAHSRGFISFARVEHCKYMVVDDTAVWIGTSNWSRDYFHNSRNVGVIVEGAAFARTLAAVFKSSWSGPYAEDLDPSKDYSAPRTDDGSGR